MTPSIFWTKETNTDKSVIVTASIVSVLAAALFAFVYSTAMATPPAPSATTNATTTNDKIPSFVLPTVVHKLIHKKGWHPCEDDPGTWCNGPYLFNETLLKIPVPHNAGPPEYIQPPQP